MNIFSIFFNKYSQLKKSTRRHIRVLFINLLVLGVFSVMISVITGTTSIGRHENSAQYFGEKYAKIDVNFSEEKGLAFEDILRFNYLLNSALNKEGISTQNESARLFVPSYCTTGKTNAYTERNGSAEYALFLVNSDYFFVHNMTLVDGSYMTDSAVNRDYAVLDVNAAWRLFGAIDVKGLTFNIGGNDYYVSGVVEVEDSKLYKDGGAASDGVIYIHSDNAGKLGVEYVNHCEYIFPEPVDEFAEKIIAAQLKTLGVAEKNYTMINSTERFGYVASLKRIKDFGKRGMSFKEVAYPYWENAAVSLENYVDLFNCVRTVAGAVIIMELLFIIVPAYIQLDKAIKRKIRSRRGIYSGEDN